MYAKFENGLLYTSEEAADGYKPVVFTEAPECGEGEVALFYWRETEDKFVQTWEIVVDTGDELSPEEALNILLGGGET